MTTPKSVQLQGGFAPWTPLGAQPLDPHYRLALRARHMAPSNLYFWIRPWLLRLCGGNRKEANVQILGFVTPRSPFCVALLP